jgi:hypothetical protein
VRSWLSGKLCKNCIDTNRDIADVLRHIIKNVLAAKREAKGPVAHQERRRRCDVSEEEFDRRQALVKHQSFGAWLQHTVNATHFKSKENLNFWSERPAECEVAQDGMGRIWLPWSWERSVGWTRSHGKIKGHSTHHARQGAHIDRKNHLGNVSGSALASHLLQQGLGHGARRHEDIRSL